MTSTTRATIRRSLFSAAAVVALAAPGIAMADGLQVSNDSQLHAADVVNDPLIVSTNGISPQDTSTPNNRDFGVTGLGEMYLRSNQTLTGGFVCSGTLINPRTVIFAAHCVDSDPASNIGFAKGGKAVSFGFEDDNRAAVRLWLGLASTTGGTDANPALYQNKTNVARHLYNVEQVWYDPNANNSYNAGFLQSDVALATLDTPATNVPTWALLFSPLTSEAHGLQIGYGVTSTTNQGGTVGGNAAGVDFRRRAAENVISFLGSLVTRDNFLFGPGSDDPRLVAAVYQLDFDSPGTAGVNRTSPYDFDIFKGGALPNEGITGGGDSGSALIVDQKYTKQVVAAVLSFGSRFFNAQPSSSYGTSSGYQPLFLYWDEIVANNPYKYVSAKSGNGAWTDPAHWIQNMDPNYNVDRGGTLVNALPGQLGQRESPNVTNFGTVCYTVPGYSSCQNIANGITFNSGTGAGLTVAGGPGSTNFVPNNVVSSQSAYGTYYDVTLSNAGTTTLGATVGVDKLTITGSAGLDVQAAGTLNVVTNFNQIGGTTNVDGTIRSTDATLAAGYLTGNGTLDPTFLTNIAGAISPGTTTTIGNLTIKGDVIFASASGFLADISSTAVDHLQVSGDAQNTGMINLGGGLVFTARGTSPRTGVNYTFIDAAGGVTGTFGSVTAPGILKATVAYNANNVVVSFKAGVIAPVLPRGSTPTAIAFASGLDAARGAGFYDSLFGLYGAIDIMSPGQIAATLNRLAPTDVVADATVLQDHQSSFVLNTIGDRLSAMGTERLPEGRMSIVGTPELVFANMGGNRFAVSQASAGQNSFASLAGSTRLGGKLPAGVSGFLAGGFNTAPGQNQTSFGQNQGESSWNMAMGLEMHVSSAATIGTAFAHSSGRTLLSGGEQSWVKTNQAAAYGNYQLGGGFYGAGIASVAISNVDLDRRTATGLEASGLSGQTSATSTDLQLEGGVNLKVARGLILTPRAQLSYSSYATDGYQEVGGPTALAINSHRLDRVEGRVGMKLVGSARIGRSGWAFVPNISADFVSNLSGDWSGLTVSFAGAPGAAIDLPGISRDRAWTEVKGGMQLTNGRVGFGAALQSAIGRSDYQDNRAAATFSVRF